MAPNASEMGKNHTSWVRTHFGYFKPWFWAIILLFYHSFWRREQPSPPWRPLAPPWQAMTSTRYSTLLGIFFHYSYPTRKFYYSAEQRVMAIKAAMFQNCMLTTNLSCFPASFKYCLFPQRIYLALDALSLSIFWKSAEGGGVISYFKRDCQQILLHSFSAK